MRHAPIPALAMTRSPRPRAARLLLILASLVFLAPAYALGLGLKGCEEHVAYGAPSREAVLLCRAGYALSHDPEHKVPDWVAYHLTREKVQGTEQRSEDFRPDPDLEEGERAELADYAGSGYDRGHMAPAGSMAWSPQAMSESFLLSNMAPQIGIGFNRHIWKSLESRVRRWTKARGELYVVTGPIYQGAAFKFIGDDQVAVPTHFYKVIFDPITVEAIAFVLPHERLKTRDLPKYIVSVDKVEAMTGLDFLSRLNDEVEALVEHKKQETMW